MHNLPHCFDKIPASCQTAAQYVHLAQSQISMGTYSHFISGIKTQVYKSNLQTFKLYSIDMHVGLSLRITNMLFLNCFCRAKAHVCQGHHRQQSTLEQASLIPSAVTDNFLNLLAPGVWLIKTITQIFQKT